MFRISCQYNSNSILELGFPKVEYENLNQNHSQYEKKNHVKKKF